MEKYEIITKIGDGTFGTVAKAVCKKDGHFVAVKKMKKKYHSWDECVRLPEVDIVRRIHGHPNIVKLREVVRENSLLYFVFEFMDGDMLGIIKKAKKEMSSSKAKNNSAIPYARVQSYMRQLLLALAYIHKRGYFHRDLKPENLLIKREANNEEVVKLGDFGLVKEIRARPPFTDYVSTRWYRSPELLLQDRAYSSPIDIWAAGCLMAELITTRPLFPGTNEIDQLSKIMKIMGAPSDETWPGGMKLARRIRYKFPNVSGSGLAKSMPTNMPADALDILGKMLLFDPTKRPTAEQCLQHPFFHMGGDTGRVSENKSETGSTTQNQLAEMTRRLQTGTKSAPAAMQGHLTMEPTTTTPANEHAQVWITHADGQHHKVPQQNNSINKVHELKSTTNSSSMTVSHSAQANVDLPALVSSSLSLSPSRTTHAAKPSGSVENPFNLPAATTSSSSNIHAAKNSSHHYQLQSYGSSKGSHGAHAGTAAAASLKNVSTSNLHLGGGVSNLSPNRSREMGRYSIAGTDFIGKSTPTKVASMGKADRDQALSNLSNSSLLSKRTSAQLPALMVTGIRPPGAAPAAAAGAHATRAHDEAHIDTLHNSIKPGPYASVSPLTTTTACAAGLTSASSSAFHEHSTAVPRQSQEKQPGVHPLAKSASTLPSQAMSPGESDLSDRKRSLPSVDIDSIVEEFSCGFHSLDDTAEQQRMKEKLKSAGAERQLSPPIVAAGNGSNISNSRISGYPACATLAQHNPATQSSGGASIHGFKVNKSTDVAETSNGSYGYNVAGLKNVSIGRTLNNVPSKSRSQPGGHVLPSAQRRLISPPVETQSSKNCTGVCFFH